MAQYEPYVRGWRERWAREDERDGEARETARALADRLAGILCERFGARRVVLAGSLARGEFRRGSDIDLAVAALRDEVARLERVVREAAAVSVRFADAEPGVLELRGIGDVVHDFYTGAERMFEKIAPELNGGVPAGPAWHRELLRNMTLNLPGIRPPLITEETARLLDEFLRFRHLFRAVYGFELEWPRLRSLLGRLPASWEALRRDVDAFLRFLDEAAAAS